MPASLPEPAKAIWRQLVPPLAEANMLRDVDVAALEALCVQVARMRQARKALAAHEKRTGSIYTTGSTGQLVEHPALATERNAAAQIMRWTERFGLDPMARTRLGNLGQEGKTLEKDITASIGQSPRLRVVGE
jgi:P27 family predicted phage terminase small subunit